MRLRPPSRLAALAAAAVVAALITPIALCSWASSTTAQSAAYSSGTLGTPSGLTLGWGTCLTTVSFEMDLSWTAAANATSYQILRGTTTGGPYTQVGTTGGTTYIDTGPQVGPPAFNWNTTYYYVVRATVGGWTSSNSNEASMRTPKAANCK